VIHSSGGHRTGQKASWWISTCAWVQTGPFDAGLQVSRTPLLRPATLALSTEHRCPLGDLLRAQGRPTESARKAGSPIHPMFILERTPPTIDGAMVADRAAAKLDGMCQNLARDLRKSRHDTRWHTMRWTLGMQTRPEQDLVHVDVAETSDPTLVQQQ